MIHLTEGNLLTADAQALVNTVNTQGVMGKGIALQFKKAWPDMYKAYQKACKRGEIRIGQMYVYETPSMLNPRFIINFPTKTDWRKPSKLDYIDQGLQALVDEIKARGIESIAIPPLGCGLGGLPWEQVLPRIEQALSQVPDVEAWIYEPKGSPVPEQMLNQTPKPPLTLSRALVLKLFHQYQALGYELTLLEAQKLLYFFQEAGEPLKLRFAKRHYGPYADNLRHVLHAFEGHYTEGFGDGRNQPETLLKLMPGTIQEVENFLAHELKPAPPSAARLQRVEALIEGFESPYGLELLASVHWLVTQEQLPLTLEAILNGIQTWSERKALLMKPRHLTDALERLSELNWFQPTASNAPIATA